MKMNDQGSLALDSKFEDDTCEKSGGKFEKKHVRSARVKHFKGNFIFASKRSLSFYSKFQEIQ